MQPAQTAELSLARFVSVSAVVVLLFAGGVNGQRTATQSANGWMKTPTPQAELQDDVSAAVRDARNRFFDKGLGETEPLTPLTASARHVGGGSHYLTGNPEIPKVRNRTVITGTFLSSRSILTPSRRAIYTEVTFSVDQVFEAPNGLVPGSNITVAIAGGTVKREDGAILSYLVDPKEFFIQPNKKYLLVLSYEPRQEFYSLAKDWDVSSGVVKPNSEDEKARADEGNAVLDGASEANLPALLPPELAHSH